MTLCRLTELLDHHPYDLSGGEQQRAALAKVMLLEPDILLMDEPTKGLDAEFKQSFAAMVRSLLSGGVTVLMVSHDVEFCARYAHRCALFFDGSISAEGTPRSSTRVLIWAACCSDQTNRPPQNRNSSSRSMVK